MSIMYHIRDRYASTFPLSQIPLSLSQKSHFPIYLGKWESEVIPLEALYHKGLHLNFPLSHFPTFPFSWESVSPCSIRVFPTFPLSHIYIPILVGKVGKRIPYICIHIGYINKYALYASYKLSKPCVRVK